MEATSNFLHLLVENNYRVLSIDLPGHGQSEQLQNTYIKNFIDIIYKILCLNNFYEFQIVAHSMGSQIALACISDNKFRQFTIKGAALFCPSGIKVKHLSVYRSILLLIGYRLKSKYLAKKLEQIARDISLKNLDEEQIEQEIQLFKEYYPEYKYHELKKYFVKLLLTFPFNNGQEYFIKADKLMNYNQFTIVLCLNDLIIDTEKTYKFICKNMSNVQIRLLSNIGHEILYSNPQLVLDIIQDQNE